ncbi:MAG: uncharacterized protein A8A55_1908 [Amphiamblys sp. WSBS2006]|nr:MAG: uncharacterized protein A8A55_1908 [Amphiamblys sp. WSBS2006]
MKEIETVSVCMRCGDKNRKAFLFPTCRMVHSFACEDCMPEILRDGGSACGFPSCINNNLLKETFGKTVEQHIREWIEINGAAVQPQTIDLLTLAIPELLTETILLNPKTVVTLENIALSDDLLFTLLKKTKVVVGENVSVFGNLRGEDCIRAGTDFEELCLLRPAYFPMIKNNTLFIENITRMPDSSIKLGKVKKLEPLLFAINILPKLKLHEEIEMEEFHLHAFGIEDIPEVIRAENNSIWLGRVKKLELERFSINILPKLKLHEENVMEEFCLWAYRTEYVSEAIRAENNNIWLGKVKKLELKLFAINILPKLKLHEENVMEKVCFDAYKPHHVSGILCAADNSIWLGKVKKLELNLFAINTLSKLVLHKENEMERFHLSAEKKEYVSEVMNAENNTIKLGKVKKLELSLFAINILPKLALHEENKMEEFVLKADREGYVSETMLAKNNTIWLGKVKKLELSLFAINTLSKLVLHKENEMERFHLSAEKKEYVSEVMNAENNTIKLGKVKKLELSLFAINILPKLDLHEENEMKEFILSAEKKEYVSGIILAENNSIKLGRVKKLELHGYSANVLSKLVLHEENEMERFHLSVEKEEYVSEIMNATNNSIWLGKVKRLELTGYSVNTLPKLLLHEENKMEKFLLGAEKEEHVSKAIRADKNSIKLGKVKKLELSLFGINILPKLALHEENEMGEFLLNTRKKEHVSEIISADNSSIWLRKVKKLELCGYAINILPKLAIHEDGEIEEFCLFTRIEEYVSEVMCEENNSIWLGKVKRLELSGYSVNILLKLRLHEENEMEELVLNAPNTGNVSEIEKTENNSINTRKLKNLKLWSHAINALPKLRGGNVIEELVIADVDMICCSKSVFSSDIDFCFWEIKKLKIENSAIDVLEIRKRQNCVLDRFEFVPREKESFSCLKIRHCLSRIDIGWIRQNGLFVPEELRQILKYTLVDEEGNEVAKKKTFFTW